MNNLVSENPVPDPPTPEQPPFAPYDQARYARGDDIIRLRSERGAVW